MNRRSDPRADEGRRVVTVIKNKSTKRDQEFWNHVEGVVKQMTTPDKPVSGDTSRCPVCLSGSRKYGNMRPCENAWHTERTIASPELPTPEQIAEKHFP